MNKDAMFNKFLEVMNRFAQIKAIVAIKDGFIMTTPPVIAGLLLDGWQGAVIQVINLVLATAIYLPFVKKMDNNMVEEEKEAA